MGFMSPEALNKAFGDRRRMPDPKLCEICEKSDIYQLGMIYFYILQGEIPVGCLDSSDFDTPWNSDEVLRDVVTSMLQFRKVRRPTLDKLLETLIM